MPHQRRPTESPLATLTPREKEILVLLATGMSNDNIACLLSLSCRTVAVHLYNIYRKLNVRNRTSATVYAIRCGIVRKL